MCFEIFGLHKRKVFPNSLNKLLPSTLFTLLQLYHPAMLLRRDGLSSPRLSRCPLQVVRVGVDVLLLPLKLVHVHVDVITAHSHMMNLPLLCRH